MVDERQIRKKIDSAFLQPLLCAALKREGASVVATKAAWEGIAPLSQYAEKCLLLGPDFLLFVQQAYRYVVTECLGTLMGVAHEAQKSGPNAPELTAKDVASWRENASRRDFRTWIKQKSPRKQSGPWRVWDEVTVFLALLGQARMRVAIAGIVFDGMSGSVSYGNMPDNLAQQGRHILQTLAAVWSNGQGMQAPVRLEFLGPRDTLDLTGMKALLSPEVLPRHRELPSFSPYPTQPPPPMRARARLAARSA
jgi:hypothetical protein